MKFLLACYNIEHLVIVVLIELVSSVSNSTVSVGKTSREGLTHPTQQLADIPGQIQSSTIPLAE